MTPKPLELFYSYSHKDEELRDQLENHLSTLKREGVISGWHDRRISAGQEWDGEIDEHLSAAEIVLLLVSADFLASNYCFDVEVKRAMERHEANDARVIPVILRPCDWQSAPFGRVQALPQDAKPVTRWTDRDEALLDIARGIRIAANEINSSAPIANFAADEPAKPAPHLHIPDILRVEFVTRKDRDGKDIVGRLSEELAPNRNRLIALWGAGGVGKTAIAAEVARALVGIYKQRVVWISADGREEFSVTTVLDEIATQLGHPDLRKLAFEAKKLQVREILTALPTLVVLDNFETIAPDKGVSCAEWLAQPALCSAIITTRQNIKAAHRNIPAETMRPNEAETLLQRSIAEAHDQNAFTKLDRELVLEVSEANPLVLQWIVRQIDLAQDAEEVLSDLKHGEGTAAERVFNRSFELKQLDNGGRAVLLALSLFVPSATRKALSEVAGLDKDKDRKRFRDSVKTLSSLWLLRTAETGERLAVEGLTRELTKIRLSRDPRSQTIRPRFVTRFRRYSEVNSKPTAERLDLLEDERENILAAVDLAIDMSDWIDVTKTVYAILRFLDFRGYWDEAIRRGKQAFEAAKNAKDDYQIGVFADYVGDIYFKRGEHSQAKDYLHQAVRIAKRLNAHQGLASTLGRLASIAHLHGEIGQARLMRNESLDISRGIADKEGISASLFGLAILEYHQGNIDEAKRFCNESFEISKELGDELAIAASLHQSAALAHHQGEFGDAQQLYNRSIQIAKRLGALNSIAGSLRELGVLAHEQGELGKARVLYDDSLEIYTKLGNQSGIAYTLHQLGALHLAENDLDQAERLLRESKEILRKVGDKRNYSECLESLGKLRATQGQFVKAERLYIESLEIAKTLGIQFRIASVNHSLGLLAEKQTDKSRASQLLHEALTIFEKLRSWKAEEVRRDLHRIEAKEP